MNTTLSSLPPPSFGPVSSVPGDVALRGPGATSQPALAALDDMAGGDTLHVGSDSTPRAIDAIERDFLAALCENPPA